MDFIEGLSKLGRPNSIMRVVTGLVNLPISSHLHTPSHNGCNDGLSKFAHFISLTHPFTDKQVFEIFIERLVSKHGSRSLSWFVIKVIYGRSYSQP